MIIDELFVKFSNLTTIHKNLMVKARAGFNNLKIDVEDFKFIKLYGFSFDDSGEMFMYCNVESTDTIFPQRSTKCIHISKIMNSKPITDLHIHCICVAQEKAKILNEIKTKYLGKRIKIDSRDDELFSFNIHSIKGAGNRIMFVDANDVDSIYPEDCTIYDQD